MKKITFALLVVTFGLQAQDFPSPYCDIEDTSVEEISLITFGETTITNTDYDNILVDKTATIVNVTQEATYTIVVKGNTYGDFETDIVAFIDWNQNNILDDEGEIYEIGTLSNTDGEDEVSVTMDITVPTDAIAGPTRIRITKVYTDSESVATINPCEIAMAILDYGVFPGYGQAIDFTLDVAVLGVNKFDVSALSVYPVPTKDILNISYKSVLNSVSVFNLLGQEVVAQNFAVSNVQLDLSSLTAGVYIVKLNSEEGQHNFRIIKE